MPDPGERTGIDTKAVARAGMAIVAGLALALAGAYVAWKTWGQAGGHPAPNTPFDLRVEGPALESAPQADRAAYMAEKEKLLHGYQWIDRQAGIARIPIEQAMRILADNAAVDATPQQGAMREKRR
jgi:hypothetical protein